MQRLRLNHKLGGLMRVKGGTPLERFKALGNGNKSLYNTLLKGLKQKHFPKVFELLIDIGCNQQCVHCFLGQTKNRTISTSENSIRIGNILLENHYGIIPYPTEPLMSEDSFSTYVRFLSKGADFLTNGSAPLTLEPINTLLKRFVENKVKVIRISLHGATEQTHEAITRTSGSFKATLSFIKKIGQKLKKFISELILTTVINRQNISELDDIFKIAVQNNIKHITTLKIMESYQSEIPQKMIMNKEATIEALLEINRLRIKYRGQLHIELGQSWGPNFHNPGIWKYLAHQARIAQFVPYCFAIGFWLTIHPEKREIYPCMTMSGLPELKIGDFIEKSHEIQFNTLGNQLLKWHQEWPEKAKSSCAIDVCQYSEICHGGCRAAAIMKILKKGAEPDWFAPFPNCQTRILKELS
ncbi:MAG: SPASM domain-containing protein [Promethearchaeota archaeon]